MASSVTITALDSLVAASLQSDDVLPIVDVHDSTQAPAGSTKKITVAALFTAPTFAGQVFLANGTVALPSLAFTNDPDCGLYRIGTNEIGVAINGAKVGDWTTTGLGISAAVPVLSITDTDTSGGAFRGNLSFVDSVATERIRIGRTQDTTGDAEFNLISGSSLYLKTNNTTALTISSSQAATFANTVNATTFVGALTGNVTGNVSGSSGSTTGNAATATKLQTARTINGVSFDGTANITVSAATVGTLTFGTYLQAANASFSGSAATISTNATSAATVSTLVARDSSAGIAVAALTATTGAFSSTLGATGLITATGGVLINGGSLAAGTLYKSASAGLAVVGVAGSSNDFTLLTPGGSTVFGVATGTVNVALAGALSISGALTGATTGAFSSTVTGGTYNGQTISSAASFTGSLTMAAGNYFTIGTKKVLYSDGSNGTSIHTNDVVGLLFRNQADSTTLGTITNAGAFTWVNNFTVSTGTTAVQALTATTGSFSSTLGVTGVATFATTVDVTNGDIELKGNDKVLRGRLGGAGTDLRLIGAGTTSGKIEIDGNAVGTLCGASLTVAGAVSGRGISNFSRANASAGTANSVFDDLVVGSTSTTNTGLTIFATGQAGIAFGDAGASTQGQIRYQHSTDALELASNGTVALTLASNQNATFAATVTALKFKGGSSATTVTIGAAAGVGASAVVTGNDTSGQITVTLGTGLGAAGAFVTLNFNSAYTGTPRAVVAYADSSAVPNVQPVIYWQESTTTIVINTVNGLQFGSVGTTVKLNYLVFSQ